ncbi:MAG: 5-methylthioadenosine phosphorylase [Thermomicrobiales bacterium]|nr:5-methylthioadenosine phosphorylase [Thermomicrobiales bacterium]
MANGKLGIIGGSGLYDLPDLQIDDRLLLETPFGPPSDRLIVGHLGSTDVVFLPRHGAGHRLTPSELPYRANIYALKQLGVTHLLTVSAVGSLKEELPPLTIVLPDQIIDRTVARPRTFFEGGAVAHVGLAHPFCPCLSGEIARAAATTGIPIVEGGTYLCIEGPQFSTRAESMLYRSWDAAVIGMTAMPEARLAREAELCYATIAMVTDYDVWHETEGPVTVEMVVANLRANTEAAKRIVRAVADQGLPDRTCACGDALRDAIVTAPDAITPETRRRLGVIAERYLGAPVP